jgi:DNA-binding NarL/FixJ family response regulator
MPSPRRNDDPGAASSDPVTPVAWPNRGRRSPIRVALLDDHHLVREGLRALLEKHDGLLVVGEAADHREAFDLVALARPDVLLLDVTFPDGDGIAILRGLHARHPDLRVVVLTMDRGPETVRQAMLAGASGYVVKGARSRDLIEAIRAVSRGERYLHSSVTAAIVDDSIRSIRSGSQLSAREREILGLLAAGHRAVEISGMLGISVHTVRRHTANASEKLGIHGGPALVRYAIAHGLSREG